MKFDTLEKKKLPKEVWSLIQRGLNHVGVYQGTYMGVPGQNTKKGYETYIRGSSTDDDWLQVARKEIGTKEFLGLNPDGSPKDNPDVVKYLKSVGGLDKSSAQLRDETPWCSAFVNWCMEKTGKKGTESAAARSWLKWGKTISTPQIGCVVVLWRGSPSGWQGHVGFLTKVTKKNVYLLGGNQSNAVNIKPYKKSRVLGYRLP